MRSVPDKPQGRALGKKENAPGGLAALARGVWFRF